VKSDCKIEIEKSKKGNACDLALNVTPFQGFFSIDMLEPRALPGADSAPGMACSAGDWRWITGERKRTGK
jgi:hypothetical protein